MALKGIDKLVQDFIAAGRPGARKQVLMTGEPDM